MGSGLNAHQRAVARAAIGEATRLLRGHPQAHKILKALAESGIVEDHFNNSHTATDSDSLGFLQQRPSQGWGTPAQVTNVRHATRSFVTRAMKVASKYGTSGELAQAVQVSAYPARYNQAGHQAGAVLREIGAGGGSGPGPMVSHGSRRSTGSGTPQTVEHVDTTGAIIDALLSGSTHPITKAAGAVSAGLYTSQTPAAPKPVAGKHGKAAAAAIGAPTPTGKGDYSGLVKFDGKWVTPFIAGELKYARAHGWRGSVNSGYRTDAEQVAIYKSGVRPAAVPKSMGGPGSNHSDKKHGAVDVSDAESLDRILRRRGSRLKWAGGKDPVHFSIPHGGSY